MMDGPFKTKNGTPTLSTTLLPNLANSGTEKSTMRRQNTVGAEKLAFTVKIHLTELGVT